MSQFDTTARTETAAETPEARSKRLTDVLLELGAGTDMEPDDIRNAIAEHPEFGNEITNFAFDWLTEDDVTPPEGDAIPPDILKAATQAFHQTSLVANDKDCVRILAGYLLAASSAPALASPQHPVGVREARRSIRDAFEAWAVTDHRATEPLPDEGRDDENGNYYVDDADNNCFIGWREASRISHPPAQDAPGAAVAQLRQIIDRIEDQLNEFGEAALPIVGETIGMWRHGQERAGTDKSEEPKPAPAAPKTRKYVIIRKPVPAETEQDAPPVEAAIRLDGIDEYGPRLGWFKSWTSFPIGTLFAPIAPARDNGGDAS